MTRPLIGALSLALASLVALWSLWERDRAALLDARADLSAARAAAEVYKQRATRCLGLVDAERAAVERCQRDSEEAARNARATERAACGELVRAAEARGALDVERSDVRAVVEALRRRRR